MPAHKLKEKISEQENKIAQLKIEIDTLSNEIENQKEQHKNSLESKELEWKQKDEEKEQQHGTAIEELENKVEELEEDLEEKQSQLDRKEAKKLAEAFSTQEIIHEEGRKFWLKASALAAVALVMYAGYSVNVTLGKDWVDRLGYYAIDFILISVVWFCSSQFSEATRLKYDYGNRKTLAQSFHNILNNLSEDGDIKQKFIEKTTDVLCAPVGSLNKEPILSKKVIKDVAEIFATVAKH